MRPQVHTRLPLQAVVVKAFNLARVQERQLELWRV